MQVRRELLSDGHGVLQRCHQCIVRQLPEKTFFLANATALSTKNSSNRNPRTAVRTEIWSSVVPLANVCHAHCCDKKAMTQRTQGGSRQSNDASGSVVTSTKHSGLAMPHSVTSTLKTSWVGGEETTFGKHFWHQQSTRAKVPPVWESTL